MSTPLLSLVMMVKNEEAFLEDALRSAQPLCDELVVVDTGSTDRTVQIARDLGARVSSFAWCDDFSAARNETLRQARGRWVAVLDADERFRCADPTAVRALLVPGPDFPCEGLSLPVVNVTLEGQVISRFQSVRIFGNAPDRIAYVGRVHNQLRSLDPARPRIQARVCPALEVVHLGYDKRVYRDRKKAERSLPLIEASMRDEPRDPRWRFYLGREYALLGRPAEAAAQYREGLALGWTAWRNGAAPDFLSEMLVGALEAGQMAEGVTPDLLARAFEHLAHFGSDTEVWVALATFNRRSGQPQDALRCLEHARASLAFPLPHPSAYAAVRAQPSRIDEERGHTLVALRHFREAYAAFLGVLEHKPDDSPGWPELLNLACGLALDLGDSARLPALLQRLVTRHDTPLDMVWVALDQGRLQPTAAMVLLDTLCAASDRLRQAPETLAWRARASR